MLRILDERVLVRDVAHTSGIGEIIIFYDLYLFKQTYKFLFKNCSIVKIYFDLQFEFKFEFFIFIYELDRFDRCSELTFIFHVIYFIFGARPSWSSLQLQLNLIISFHYSARRLRGVYLCLIMVSSPTSAKIACAALWDLGA